MGLLIVFSLFCLAGLAALEPKPESTTPLQPPKGETLPNEREALLDNEVPDERSFSNVMVPGLQGGVYYLFESGDLYYGGEMLFDLAFTLLRSSKSESFLARGRSEVYISIGFYYSNRDEAEYFFHYLFGFNVSLESANNLDRNFLIPYMGLAMGVITIKDRGTGFMAYPILGVNIVSLKALSINVESGLLLSTVAFDEFLALRTSLMVVFAL